MGSELLNGFRMLDLSNEKGALCGRIFADLGADVIKIEPPAGCSTRRIPPYLEDRAGPDRSLYFLAYQAGKRSVTIDIESAAGGDLARSLIKKSDFVVESFAVGYLDSIGLGYQALAALNPRIIHTSITPFGDRGPGKTYKGHDINVWAAGGMMYLMGKPDRPPLQMSLPQAGLHAGAEAAVASVIAHYARGATGEGQHVVVDMQACIVWTLMNEQAMPILHGDYLKRTGVHVGSAGVRRKVIFQCRDGYISALIGAGASTKALADWMLECGFGAQWMKTKDWLNWTPAIAMTKNDQEQILDLEERVQRFFMTMTKREIYEEALKRRLLLAPVADASDIASDPQLKAREYFVPIRHETLDRTMTLPGPFAKLSQTPIGPSRRAPTLGEHTDEVLSEIAGYEAAKIKALRSVGAI
jgi:crotonobetainyl-CoA:carnitine CoA-transferase CaiB-like acyl-CoA transferase